MNHGVHAMQHEVEHKIKHEQGHSGIDGISRASKLMALVIAVLALFLSFAEMAGKGAQTEALDSQMDASELWGFFQAKNIRRTSNLIAAEQAQLSLAGINDPDHRAAIERAMINTCG